MRPPVGHALIRAELERALPPVALLVGPASVGKRTLAEYLLVHHRVHPADVLRVDPLSADAARDVKAFAGRAPFGAVKVVLITLDGAREQAQHILLKVLEEPPPPVHFLLRAARLPLSTVVSRSVVYRFGLLPEPDLVEVLHRCGMAGDTAEWAAGRAGGQVRAALAAGQVEPDSGAVHQVLKAVAVADPELLVAATKGDKWGEVQHELLVRWAIEARSGRWRLFDRAGSFGLADGPVPIQVLEGLAGSLARPKLAVRAALAPLCQAW